MSDTNETNKPMSIRVNGGTQMRIKETMSSI